MGGGRSPRARLASVFVLLMSAFVSRSTFGTDSFPAPGALGEFPWLPPSTWPVLATIVLAVTITLSAALAHPFGRYGSTVAAVLTGFWAIGIDPLLALHVEVWALPPALGALLLARRERRPRLAAAAVLAAVSTAVFAWRSLATAPLLPTVAVRPLDELGLMLGLVGAGLGLAGMLHVRRRDPVAAVAAVHAVAVLTLAATSDRWVWGLAVGPLIAAYVPAAFVRRPTPRAVQRSGHGAISRPAGMELREPLSHVLVVPTGRR